MALAYTLALALAVLTLILALASLVLALPLSLASALALDSTLESVFPLDVAYLALDLAFAPDLASLALE
jgi:ABC-type phosphate transport system permease subunit